MFWYMFAVGLSHAAENSDRSIGVRIEHLPLPDNLSDLNDTQIRWMPWLVYKKGAWNIKGSVLANSNSQQSKTSETTEQTVSSQTLLAIEGERILSADHLHWTIGLGIHSNLPVIKQYSSQFTESEQEDVDTQVQNQMADLSFTRFRLPCTVQIPVHKYLQVGLGFQTSYTIQRSQSDFTTYLNTSWYTSPILTVQIL